MSLELALKRYLADTEPVTGPSADQFKPQMVGDRQIRTRDEAKIELRNILADNIFQGRLPQMAGKLHTWMLLELQDSEAEYALDSEKNCPEDYLRCTIWGQYKNGRDRVDLVADYLRLAVSAFRQGYWGDLFVDSCLVDNDFSDATRSGLADDDWLFSRDLELRIFAYKPVANQWMA